MWGQERGPGGPFLTSQTPILCHLTAKYLENSKSQRYMSIRASHQLDESFLKLSRSGSHTGQSIISKNMLHFWVFLEQHLLCDKRKIHWCTAVHTSRVDLKLCMPGETVARGDQQLSIAIFVYIIIIYVHSTLTLVVLSRIEAYNQRWQCCARKGGGALHTVLTAARVCRILYASCWRTCFLVLLPQIN